MASKIDARDLIGRRFGRLTVIDLLDDRSPYRYLCHCECGNDKVVRRGNLLRKEGSTVSCGCYHSELTSRISLKDEVGKTYGKLKVLEPVGRSRKGKVIWRCQCDCGNICDVVGDNLRSGHTTSCGCSKEEANEITLSKRADEHYVIHGQSDTELYHRWDMIVQRCTNPKCSVYGRYGGRGIAICEEWRHDFSAFRDWMVSQGWTDGCALTVDRIDNDGPYSPANCRLADRKTQMNNKSNNVVWTYDGRTMTMKQWSEYLGWTYSTLVHRRQRGWDVEDILSTPPKNI